MASQREKREAKNGKTEDGAGRNAARGAEQQARGAAGPAGGGAEGDSGKSGTVGSDDARGRIAAESAKGKTGDAAATARGDGKKEKTKTARTVLVDPNGAPLCTWCGKPESQHHKPFAWRVAECDDYKTFRAARI